VQLLVELVGSMELLVEHRLVAIGLVVVEHILVFVKQQVFIEQQVFVDEQLFELVYIYFPSSTSKPISFPEK
jgi:hypothetical protein